MRYGPGAHRMWWKTVLSENGSAGADDGLVEILAADGGEATRVIISGRQQFALPPFAEWLRLDLQPELQATLTAQAYGVFARRTFANFDAVVEGRDPRIGKAWPRAGEETPRPVEVLSRWIDQAQAGEGPLAQLVRWFDRSEVARAAQVDEDGFTHVPGPGTAPLSRSEEPDEPPPSKPKVLHG
jgi:hypothetical protein